MGSSTPNSEFSKHFLPAYEKFLGNGIPHVFTLFDIMVVVKALASRPTLNNGYMLANCKSKCDWEPIGTLAQMLVALGKCTLYQELHRQIEEYSTTFFLYTNSDILCKVAASTGIFLSW